MRMRKNEKIKGYEKALDHNNGKRRDESIGASCAFLFVQRWQL